MYAITHIIKVLCQYQSLNTWFAIAENVFHDWESCPLALDGIAVGNEAPCWPKLKLGISDWQLGMFCGKDSGPIWKN